MLNCQVTIEPIHIYNHVICFTPIFSHMGFILCTSLLYALYVVLSYAWSFFTPKWLGVLTLFNLCVMYRLCLLGKFVCPLLCLDAWLVFIYFNIFLIAFKSVSLKLFTFIIYPMQLHPFMNYIRISCLVWINVLYSLFGTRILNFIFSLILNGFWYLSIFFFPLLPCN